MGYSPASKSKKKNLSDDELYNLRCSIYNKYRDAILNNNYSGYNSAYKDYLCYVENGGMNHYLSIAMKDYRFQYKKQQYIEMAQHDALPNIISVALNDTKDTIVVSGGYGNKKLAEFGEQASYTCSSPTAEVVKGTELDYHNTTETKHKTFEEMSYEEKIKSVNKEIDDVLDFIERNKQAKYNKYKKEFCK